MIGFCSSVTELSSLLPPDVCSIIVMFPVSPVLLDPLLRVNSTPMALPEWVKVSGTAWYFYELELHS